MNKEILNYIATDLVKDLQHIVKKMLLEEGSNLLNNHIINENNIFQKAYKKNRPIVIELIKRCLQEGSGLEGIENWKIFYDDFKKGKSSLILSEHKSNLDVVIFNYLMSLYSKDLEEAFEDIVFIAGRKLNEESTTVKLFAEMYNRLIVVPKSETQEVSEEETNLVYRINYTAQTFLKENINKYIYFIYPTGTRSRPYEPKTYQGITETVNYLRKFDQIIFMSTDGNCMFPIPGSEMDGEPLIKDKITIKFSKPLSVKDFIKEAENEFSEYTLKNPDANFKTFLTSKVTDSIYKQKPIPPWEEFWVTICKKLIENSKK